jgi:hypothetical protein
MSIGHNQKMNTDLHIPLRFNSFGCSGGGGGNSLLLQRHSLSLSLSLARAMKWQDSCCQLVRGQLILITDMMLSAKLGRNINLADLIKGCCSLSENESYFS